MNFKSLLLIAITSILIVSCNSDTMKIEGKIDPSITKLYLIKEGEPMAFDSFDVKNGAFSHSLKVQMSDLIQISNIPMMADVPNVFRQYFVMEPGTVKMDFDIVNPIKNKVSGKLNDIFNNTLTTVRELYEKNQSYFMAAQQNDPAAIAVAQKVQDSISNIVRNVFYENKNNVLSLWALSMSGGDSALDWFNKVDTQVVNNTGIGKAMKEQVKMMQKQNATPDKTPNTKFTSLDGKTVSFNDLKGKFVFVDFWAYWCKPCRAANPKIAALYAKYKDQITFLSISIDPSKEKWQKAVKEDQLTWSQWIIGENQNENQELIETYGIVGIPHGLLIGPDGKAIKNGMRSEEEIEAAIQSILK